MTILKTAIAAIVATAFAAPAFADPIPTSDLPRIHVPGPAAPIPSTPSRIHVPAQAVTPATPRADLLARADRAAAADREVSPAMQTLISEFVHTSIRMAATDISGDNEAIGIVAETRTRALAALAFHQPANLTELAAKTAALVEFSEDTERFSLRVLVEDANRLAEGTR